MDEGGEGGALCKVVSGRMTPRGIVDESRVGVIKLTKGNEEVLKRRQKKRKTKYEGNVLLTTIRLILQFER